MPRHPGARDTWLWSLATSNAALVKTCWKAITFAICPDAARAGHPTDMLRIYLNSLAAMR
jgi:hypothetical protein